MTNRINQDDREKAIELAISQIEKQFGKGSLMRLGDKKSVEIGAISTGCISLDAAIGIGGVPRGRIVELYGPEAGGKTSLALHITAEAQKLGGVVAYIDAEHALDSQYAERLGVNTQDLFISQPDSGEQALEIVDRLAQSGAIDLIIVDSVAALVPRAELDGDMGDSHVGLQARLMSQALRKLTAVIARTNTCLIFINQIREKIGTFYGSPETQPGGRALKFYASVRLDIRKVTSAAIKDGDIIIGNRVKVKVVKNKVSPPFREAEFDIIFGKGISRAGDLLDLAVAQKIIEKGGSWYSYNGEKLGQGREKIKELLEVNSPLMTELEQRVKNNLGLNLNA